MQKILFRSFLLSSVSTLTPSHAADANIPSHLAETVVTATRNETLSNELATANTVFLRDDIERLQVRTLPELLQKAPGVDIVQSGGYGQPSSVFMRGTNSSHVLVLIDGIRVGSVTAGISAFEILPIDQIERVEIIRGPQSSLYGSEAIGGVIQIFTRRGQRTDKPSISLEAGGGAYDTHHEAGNVSGQWQNNWYNLGVSNIESSGINARTLPADPDRDAYQNTAINARVGHRFDNDAQAEAFFVRTQGLNAFDNGSRTDQDCLRNPYGYCANQREFVNQVVGTNLTANLTRQWKSTLNLGQARDEATFLLPNNHFDSRLDSTRWNASWLNQITLSDRHALTLGSDYRVDEVDGTLKYNKSSRYDIGVFGDLHSQLFDRHFLNASLRWDENEAFGDYLTGNIGWRFNWQHGLSAFASFGNAFKAPTFNDLYYPLPPSWGGGNPNLKPEESTSVETGLAGTHDWLQWQIRAYHTNIDNLIAYTYPRGMQNINKAQIDGIELEMSTEIIGWSHKLNGNLLSPRDRTSNTRLLRRADKTLSYDVSRRFGAFDLGATVLAQSDRPDFDPVAFKPATVDGFVTLDLRSTYHIDKNWMLSARLNNLLDKHYQTVSHYNMADRNFFISIHYNN